MCVYVPMNLCVWDVIRCDMWCFGWMMVMTFITIKSKWHKLKHTADINRSPMSSSDTHCTKKPRNRSHVTQKSSILDGQIRFSCTRKVAFLSPKHQALHSCTPSHCLRPVTRSIPWYICMVFSEHSIETVRNSKFTIYVCSMFEFMSVVVFISF